MDDNTHFYAVGSIVKVLATDEVTEVTAQEPPHGEGEPRYRVASEVAVVSEGALCLATPEEIREYLNRQDDTVH